MRGVLPARRRRRGSIRSQAPDPHLAAAEAVGYTSIGIEKDKHYFDIAREAIARLAALPAQITLSAPSARYRRCKRSKSGWRETRIDSGLLSTARCECVCCPSIATPANPATTNAPRLQLWHRLFRHDVHGEPGESWVKDFTRPSGSRFLGM